MCFYGKLLGALENGDHEVFCRQIFLADLELVAVLTLTDKFFAEGIGGFRVFFFFFFALTTALSLPSKFAAAKRALNLTATM